jgi:sugar lactone lactonase YvrE
MTAANYLRLGALALTIFAGALAGCGGGGGAVPHAGGGSSQGTLAEGTLHIVVPEKTTNGARRPAYISPATTQLVWSDGGSAQTVALSTANPACSGSGSGLSCTVNFYIAPGSYTFSFTLEDGSNKALSAATSVTKTLVAGAATTLSVTLGGIAQSFSLGSTTSNFATPSSGSNYTVYGNAPVTLTINALDADGNTIVGSGSLGVSATLSPVPTASASAIPATATFAAGSSNTWTLTSTYHATSPSIVGSLSLVVSASPYPGSGVTQTLTQTYNLQFYTPWLIVSQSGSSKVLSYDEQGNAQSLAITGVPNPSSVVFGANSSTASPLPSPYLYVAAVTTATPVPTPTGANTVGPSTGAINAYNGDGSTPTLTGSFSGVGVPVGLAFDTNLNYLYVLNSLGTSLQAFSAQGNTVSISSPTIGSPTGIVFDSVNDDLYVCTTSGVFAYGETGAPDSGVSTFAGVNAPEGVAYDPNLNEIAVLNGNGTVALYAPTGGTALASFAVISSPTAIAFDPYSLWFYVANSSTIKAYGESGTLQTLSGSWSGLSTPTGITVVQ